MNVFLTGATGYIGSHLIPQLIHHGHQVTCLVRDPDKTPALRNQGLALRKGDITDRASIHAAMHGADAVFHLAGAYTIGRPDLALMRAINVDGARNTLEVAAELGIPRIVHTSTVGVFGNTHGRLADESYRAPKGAMTSVYERTKWEAHYEVAVPLQQRGAPVIIVQPGGVTGPADPSPHRVIFESFLNRTPVMLGARSGITFAHVDDIAAGHLLALQRAKPGETYILCGPALTYRKIFQLCEQITGIPATRIWAPGWMASTLAALTGALERLGLYLPVSSESLASAADYTFWATADKAKRELGWTSRPVEDLFREVLEGRLRPEPTHRM